MHNSTVRARDWAAYLCGFDLGLIEAQACPPAAAAGGAHGAGGAGAGVDTGEPWLRVLALFAKLYN